MGLNLKNLKINLNVTSVFTDQDGTQPDNIVDINAIYTDGNTSYQITEDVDRLSAEQKKQQELLNSKHSEVGNVLTDNGTTDNRFEASWDPRLRRLDYFLYTENNTDEAVRVPFGSATLASLFHEEVYSLEKAAISGLMELDKIPYGSDAYELMKGSNGSKGTQTNEKSTTNTQTKNNQSGVDKLSSSTKLIMDDLTPFRNNPYNYGVQSLVNPYSLTRLMGGIGAVGENSVENYMYDIRDKRRFYDLVSDDILSVSNPTITNIIEWGNKDKWGRTPYSFMDFVYCKYYGIIPNNRLITLRRYHAPTYDNLNFENMWGEIESPKKDAKGNNIPGEYTKNDVNEFTPKGTFSPVATVVTYFGDDTGNSMANLLSFMTGIEYTDVTSQIHTISGNEGESPQAVIDRMFEGSNAFGDTSHPAVNQLLSGLSSVSSRIMSFGKFALGCNGTYGSSQPTVDRINASLQDPYADGPYVNRIQGPLNRIESVKRRKEGIKFDQKFSIKCSYVTKAIGGLNPKAQMLDVLGNCMAMVSPEAVFWGGGHRYMIEPKVYPFHDGGWRDNFMKAIYDGKVLGKDGALSIIGSGIRKVAADKDGNISMDSITANLGNGLGEIMGAISAGLAAVASNVSIGGLSDFLSSASNFLSNTGEKVSDASAVANGAKKLGNLAKNVDHMWHDKVLQQTTFPKITGTGALLIGEPVGEWHLTVGNPFNPILTVGNLICTDMKVEFEEELGPDDFPIGFSVTYSLEHGMARDRSGIQSMLNRGMGKYYVLPDYSALASNMETHVDNFTGGTGVRTNIEYLSPSKYADVISKDGVTRSGYKINKIDVGKPIDTAKNPTTQLITKFTPPDTNANATLADIRSSHEYINGSNMAVIRSLAITRKYNG